MGMLRCIALAFLASLMTSGCIQAEDSAVLRVPAMPDWKLLHRVAPEYPAVARQRHIQGVVRFIAAIGNDGHVERLSLVSGHPLLVFAARQAILQWRYRPTTLHGNPVRVITQVEVSFTLDAHGNPLPGKRYAQERAPVV